MRFRNAFLMMCLQLLSCSAFAVDIGPWAFGMSEAEVAAKTEYGPYRAFSNGDLETFHIQWAGENRNFQFYFTDHKLVRVAIHMHEGDDLDVAAAQWALAYQAMRKQWGSMETPQMDPANAATFARQARSRTIDSARVQMAPVQQPEGAFLYATLRRLELDAKTVYAVVITIEPPKDAHRPATPQRRGPALGSVEKLKELEAIVAGSARRYRLLAG